MFFKRFVAAILLFTSVPGLSSANAEDSFAYVLSYKPNAVIPVDLSTNTPGEPISEMGGFPTDIAITPNNTRLYVTKRYSKTVTPIDLATQTLGTPIYLGEEPNAIVITPDGLTAYVVNDRSNNVTPINLATGKPGPHIPVGLYPQYIAITPDGTFAYVTNVDSQSITPIDLETNTPLAPIAFPDVPLAIAITPDGSLAYVTSEQADNVTPIDLETGTLLAPIPVGESPQGIAITPDGTTAYVTNMNDGTVTPIDLKANLPGEAIYVGNEGPVDIAITPDGAMAYVTNEFSSDMSVIDLSTNYWTAFMPLEGALIAIAITPDQAPVASFSTGEAMAGFSCMFDASASFSPSGTIITYDWIFGDGFTESTSSPMTAHTYFLPGHYTAQLTVTNSAGTSTTQVYTGRTTLKNGGPSASTAQDISVIESFLFEDSFTMGDD